MDEEEYPSDSEQSDEDYCPDELQTENLSEVESDDNVDDSEETHDNSSGKKNSSKKRKKAKVSAKDRTNDKEVNKETETVTEDVEEEDKSRADALWADFLSGTDPLPTKKPESKKVSTVKETPVPDVPDVVQPEPKKESPKKLVTQIFDFAGEKVEITKEIKETTSTVTSDKSDKSGGSSNGAVRRPPFSGLKRVGGGIGSVLGQLAKKNKISVLDKTKHDWDSFKRNEGIDEQLQTFNRGRDGYLERQDFLDRTDVRQFELEKSIRLSKRNNRNC